VLILKNLIYRQRWPPTRFLMKHRIEDHDQLMHARDYRNVPGFSCGAKTLIEGVDRRIAT